METLSESFKVALV